MRIKRPQPEHITSVPDGTAYRCGPCGDAIACMEQEKKTAWARRVRDFIKAHRRCRLASQ